MARSEINYFGGKPDIGATETGQQSTFTVGRNVDLAYSVKAVVTRTDALVYSVLGTFFTVSRAVTVSWLNRVVVTKLDAFSYAVRTFVSNTNALPYNIAASKALAMPATIRVIVTKTFDTPYVVLSAQAVTKPIVSTYQVRQIVTDTIATTYALRMVVTKLVDLQFDIPVSHPTALTYVLRNPVTKSVGLPYGVASGLVAVGANRTLSYDLLLEITRTRILVYRVAGLVSVPLTISYTIVSDAPPIVFQSVEVLPTFQPLSLDRQRFNDVARRQHRRTQLSQQQQEVSRL